MEFLSKSRIGAPLVVVAASSALFAQNIRPVKYENHTSLLDAGQIARQTIAATERSWQARDHYTYTEKAVTGPVNLMTVANAPLTTRSVPPFASVAVASDIFVAGSNGTNLINLGRLAEPFFVAAERMAASTGSWPPSELARAAIASTRAS